MEDPTVLKLIASRVDDTVLGSLSRIPSLWNVLLSELKNQFFWYERTAAAFNLPDEFQWEYGDNSQENWQQIFNILQSTKNEDPFAVNPYGLSVLEKNGYNLLAVKLLLWMGYTPLGMISVKQAIKYGDLAVVKLLLSDSRIDLRGGQAMARAMYAAIERDRLDMVQAIIEAMGDKISAKGGQQLLNNALSKAAVLDNVDILRYLLKLRPVNKGMLRLTVQDVIDHNSLGALRVLLRGFKPDQKSLLGYIDHAAHDDETEPSLKLLLTRVKNVPVHIILIWITDAAKRGNPKILRTLLDRFNKDGRLEELLQKSTAISMARG